MTNTGRINRGVATSWLKDLVPTADQTPRIPVYIRHSSLRLPYRPINPVIMVGPGTGLAPFRGFIQDRSATITNGELAPLLPPLPPPPPPPPPPSIYSLSNSSSSSILATFPHHCRIPPLPPAPLPPHPFSFSFPQARHLGRLSSTLAVAARLRTTSMKMS